MASPSRTETKWLFRCLAATALLGALQAFGCDLNPQPLPPAQEFGTPSQDASNTPVGPGGSGNPNDSGAAQSGGDAGGQAGQPVDGGSDATSGHVADASSDGSVTDSSDAAIDADGDADGSGSKDDGSD